MKGENDNLYKWTCPKQRATVPGEDVVTYSPTADDGDTHNQPPKMLSFQG